MSHKPLLRRPLPVAQCAHCDTPFQPYRAWQRFCPQPALCREISYLAGSRAGLRPALQVLSEGLDNTADTDAGIVGL